MKTKQTSIRIDADIKDQATKLFNDLGMDMSTAINIFLRQSIFCDGIPFDIHRSNNYKDDVIEAMLEAKHISQCKDAKVYGSFSEILEELDNEI